MIDESRIIDLINSRIGGSDLFLVDVSTGSSNEIRVLVDSMEGVKISECAELSRWLTAELDQDDMDFSLEVSSPGLGSPFVLKQQYKKNIGRHVEVIFKDGKKRKGRLTGVGEDSITLEVTEKMLAGGSQKKKKSVLTEKSYGLNEIKSTKVVIEI
jgi:ribosome maturation factor RimP